MKDTLKDDYEVFTSSLKLIRRSPSSLCMPPIDTGRRMAVLRPTPGLYSLFFPCSIVENHELMVL